jgi:glycosyltransferase involved in cell wall biosynthesis
MRVAVIHDWLVIYGGAERVLEHILDLYPQADLFSLIDTVPEAQRHFLRGKPPKTSFLQKIPGVHRHYRKLLPLMPFAIEQFDLSDYDLIISSSYCVAKGVLTGPNQVHVCYCHSPMRYAWDHYHEYLEQLNLQRGLKGLFVRWQLHRIRTWDVRSSNSVDVFLANSSFVAKRIAKIYRRDSVLLYPPVDTRLFTLQAHKQDYYVTAGRLVPFKRIDLVVAAFAQMPDKKLVVVGDGPEMAKLRQLAGPNVSFVGYQSAAVVREHLAHAKAFLFPSEEDFGIVPLEAQACGTPVIAYARGGALETVCGLGEASQHASAAQGEHAPTGIFFHEQTVPSLVQAVQRFEQAAEEKTWNPEAIHQHAQRFSIDAFKAGLLQHVQNAWLAHAPAFLQRKHPTVE